MVNEKEFYAFVQSSRVSEFLVIIKNNAGSNTIDCISVPTLQNEQYTWEEMNVLLKSGVLEFHEMLPDYVYNTCKAQYEQNKEQSYMAEALDRENLNESVS